MVADHPRLSRFVIVGAGANAALLGLSYLFQRAGIAAFAAGIAAYAIAFAGAYRAQHGWTFGGVQAHGTAFPRYAATQAACAVAAGLAAQLWTWLAGPQLLGASLAATITAAGMSYVLSSKWVFAAPAHDRR